MKQTKEDQLIAEAYNKVAVKEARRPIIINGKEVEDIQVETDNELVGVMKAFFTDGTELTYDEIIQLEKDYPDEIYELGHDYNLSRAERFRD